MRIFFFPIRDFASKPTQLKQIIRTTKAVAMLDPYLDMVIESTYKFQKHILGDLGSSGRKLYF